MSSEFDSEPLPAGESRLPRNGAALRPIFNLADRLAIGYEVEPRPAVPEGWQRMMATAIPLAALVTPAILLAPLPVEVLAAPDFDPRLPAGGGVFPGEVAWIIPGLPGQAQLARARLDGLRRLGFRIALEGVGWAAPSRRRMGELRPEFAILGARCATAAMRDPVIRAELTGLVAFAGQLDICLVARGVNDPRVADLLLSIGIRHGMGGQVGSPIVLDATAAAPGDRVVSESWLRHQEARPLRVSGTVLPGPDVLDITPIPEGAADDELFAHVLGEAARILQAEHDPERIITTTAELMQRVVPANSIAVFEADWEHNRLVPRLLAGSGVQALRDLAEYPMSRGITGWAFARGLPYLCADVTTHPAAATIPGTGSDRTTESMIVVPLIAGDHRLGVLDVWRDGAGSFSAHDLARCALFAHVAAAAWRNAQLYAELEERARTDVLTGLHNARWWEELAPREVARSRRTGKEIGLLLVDLDHFKVVNDTHGHGTGDRVLRQVARILRSAVRTGDAVVRFGGEEFLIMLPESGDEGALRVAETVRRELAEMPPVASGLPQVTASIGVALFPRHGKDLDEVVQAADIAMYQAKARGRNAVVMAA